MKTEGPMLQVARLKQALEEVVKVTDAIDDTSLAALADAVDAASATAIEALQYHARHAAPIKGVSDGG